MRHFSQNELIDMVFILGECDRNCLLASRVYAVRYPNRPRHPREEIFTKLLDRFLNSGSVAYRKCERSKNILNEENEFRVMVAVVENPHASTRQLSRDLEISRSSVRRILKKHKFHPFHVQLHQELEGADFQNRMNFCLWIQQQLNLDDNFAENILFSDESTFHRNGFVNTHNFHYYSDENPHYLRVNHNQHRWSVNVWAGIIGTFVIGPFFFDGPLNGMQYNDFLENHLFELLEDIPLARIRDMYFQQDGAPPHHARITTQWLNRTFPNKWIGRAGPIHWPARSPDITPLDFFLWGHVKNIVYQEPPTTADDMKIRIRQALRTITPEMLIRVTASFKKRIQACLNHHGQHFEHLF